MMEFLPITTLASDCKEDEHWAELCLPDLSLEAAVSQYNRPLFPTRREALKAEWERTGKKPRTLSYRVTGIREADFERIKVSLQI